MAFDLCHSPSYQPKDFRRLAAFPRDRGDSGSTRFHEQYVIRVDKLKAVSIPFLHPNCPEKQGSEKSRVRGKYVSVERVIELDGGAVQWRMATSSDAGGNIPRFVTNASLPNSIAEDVPSFLKYIAVKFPDEPSSAAKVIS